MAKISYLVFLDFLYCLCLGAQLIEECVELKLGLGWLTKRPCSGKWAFQCSSLILHCIGDTNGKMMLAHAASAQGISERAGGKANRPVPKGGHEGRHHSGMQAPTASSRTSRMRRSAIPARLPSAIVTDTLKQETSLRIDKRRLRTRRKRRKITGIFLKATFHIDLRKLESQIAYENIHQFDLRIEGGEGDRGKNSISLKENDLVNK
ncbi:Uncharacterized protein Fot_51263 [Forsythia ovata]|uniref:Uncharacterized protein n=1 Tax=Forsythia ovata TaxID=205694 RepID=A0ABD1PWK8_9LAMI